LHEEKGVRYVATRVQKTPRTHTYRELPKVIQPYNPPNADKATAGRMPEPRLPSCRLLAGPSSSRDTREAENTYGYVLQSPRRSSTPPAGYYREKTGMRSEDILKAISCPLHPPITVLGCEVDILARSGQRQIIRRRSGATASEESSCNKTKAMSTPEAFTLSVLRARVGGGGYGRARSTWRGMARVRRMAPPSGGRRETTNRSERY
jgi:hypothetical protein